MSHFDTHRRNFWQQTGLLLALASFGIWVGLTPQTSAQTTTLDVNVTGRQNAPAPPPLPSNLTGVFVDPANGNDSSGDGSRNNPYKTITNTLAKVGPGTIIQLLPGTYSVESGEVFPIRLKSGVILRGDESTLGEGITIVGGGTYISPTLARQNVAILAETGSEVRGVTVRNEGRRGYAIWLESMAPKIYNNSFVGNVHDGVFVAGSSSPVIQGNRFQQNGANGISVLGTSAPIIANNLFQQTGHGITVDQQSTPQIRDNRIVQNRSGVVIGGSAQPVLRGNIISQNLEAGVVVITKAPPNMGTAQDSGNNLFQDNGKFDINNATRGVPLLAAGNRINGRTRGDVQFGGQPGAMPVAATPAALPEGSPIGVAPAPKPAAVAKGSPLPAPPVQSGLPTIAVPPLRTPTLPRQDPAPVAAQPAAAPQPQGTNPSIPSPLVITPPNPAPAQPSAEFKPVPFSPAQPIAAPIATPSPVAVQPPRPTSSPLVDITTLLPRNRSAGSAPPPVASGSTGSTPSVAANNSGVTPLTQFRVLVTPKNDVERARLRQLVPGSVDTVFNGRNVVQAGLYDSRPAAQSVLDKLLDAGFEAVAEIVFAN